MLENKKFVAWANENLVVVVGHTQEDHPTEYEDAKGKKQPGCPLYRGMTCEEHRAIPRECMTGGEGIPTVKSTNMMPNSWLVTPGGEVTQIPSADQQSAGKIEEIVMEAQKAAGKHLTWKKYGKYLESFEASDGALREDKLKEAIKALQKVEKDSKKLPAGMQAQVTTRVDAINAKAVEAFEALKAGEDVAAAMKAANKLKTQVGARFKRGYLPVVAEIKAWLKETKAAAK
ncbi:MAG: hypothetical protein P1V36_11420 [Planctomycetota bacterium]|nr:hypothetical protein [Planctomycetota bacterium]